MVLGAFGHHGLLRQQLLGVEQPRFTAAAADIKATQPLSQHIGIDIALALGRELPGVVHAGHQRRVHSRKLLGHLGVPPLVMDTGPRIGPSVVPVYQYCLYWSFWFDNM